MYRKPSSTALRLLALSSILLLTACDKIPGLGPDPRVAQREEEAKAIGGACRHALRGLEDCYTLNPKAPKASVFAGWKDMDAYMRENKIEGAPSVLGKVEKPERTERSSDIETEPRDPAASRNRS
ncbi:hypothetical protein ACN9MJ_16160 [Acidovorax facilis]|jgi:hypothetical protein|uniref:Lipoprotein n=1 Tax=Acidovorax facilis TaxID=12917 RepID=A0ABV8D3Y5_9BURK|nr:MULTISPECIES: hypothetical protein [Acidovorax]ODS59345.1 MAG: hypothetical protein ABS37_20165 [Acidovorax sp. SCN 65-108]OGA61822.1 MAG: hypothetical protein A2710_11895 [Burkholderiales bacterium RIFCSPHIGHO2_01_FULL_64_960]OGA82786.1 MAG: hypothetical protein A2Z90_12945 [Burkholderiales bacterium GWA2_64_37]OJV69640.1 MAG: hypothetical protein BGO35_11480 [Burkholderiales bacterium 64-34]KQB58506.1 hypothetical protein AE621_14635 [Acidovorax sp. SD340]